MEQDLLVPACQGAGVTSERLLRNQKAELREFRERQLGLSGLEESSLEVYEDGPFHIDADLEM